MEGLGTRPSQKEPMMPEETKKLRVIVRLVRNPWPHTVPDAQLFETLEELAHEAARGIRVRRDRHEYAEDANLALVVLDPTAPVSLPSEQCVLGIILIGDGAENNITNAASKAFEHRDKGVNIGDLVYGHKHRLADGAFRWGHSACIDGTHVGASGLLEGEDRYEATLYGAGFNYRIECIRIHWEGEHSGGSWYCDEDKPELRLRVLEKPYLLMTEVPVN